jgi:D-aspartate ligase
MNNPSNKPGAIIIEGHVQGLSNTRSLGEAGIPVFVVDKTNCIARYSKYCRKFYKSPDFIKDEFADFLIELAIREKIKDWVLIPSNDHAVYTLSKHKARLEEHYKVITPGLEIIENVYDKLKLLDIAEACGLPVPVTQNFKTPEEALRTDLKFPVITKGRNGLSFYRHIRKKALLAEDEPKLRAQLHLIDDKYAVQKSFTQELIPFDGTNKTISFTAFCVEGEIKSHWTGVKLREHPLRFGTATFAQSISCDECYKQSVPLLNELNYTGVCEVEYLFDPRNGKYKLIEINARTWLWVGLAKACGVDYVKMIYNYVNGINMDYPKSYLVGMNWLNPISDLVFSLIAILTFRLNPGVYLKSILQQENVNALRLKGDNEPFYRYLTSLFSFLKSR